MLELFEVNETTRSSVDINEIFSQLTLLLISFLKNTLGELPPGSKTVNGFLIVNLLNNFEACSAVPFSVSETNNLISLLKA